MSGRRSWARGAGLGLALGAAAALAACAPPEKPPPAPPAPPEPAPPEAPARAPVFDAYGRLVVEAMEYPWSALGRLNTGGRGFCTGTLVGPRLVLATARCVYNAVEGRWWHPSEVHFVAGYQRDRAVIHAPAVFIRPAPEYVPGAGLSLGNVANNWALVTLAADIGADAGWLALRGTETGARSFRAGYRRGWEHAITLKLGCIDGDCRSGPGDAELPAFAAANGEIRVVAAPSLMARLMSAGGRSGLFPALAAGEAPGGSGRPPRRGSPAAPAPRDTIVRLLRYLDHLDPVEGAVTPRALQAAIRSFERHQGLPRTGRADVALLARLIAVAGRRYSGQGD